MVYLTKNGTDLGLYISVDAALAAMTDATADYVILPYYYCKTDMGFFSSPYRKPYISYGELPAVNSITFKNVMTDLGDGYGLYNYYYLLDDLYCNGDVIFFETAVGYIQPSPCIYLRGYAMTVYGSADFSAGIIGNEDSVITVLDNPLLWTDIRFSGDVSVGTIRAEYEFIIWGNLSADNIILSKGSRITLAYYSILTVDVLRIETSEYPSIIQLWDSSMFHVREIEGNIMFWVRTEETQAFPEIFVSGLINGKIKYSIYSMEPSTITDLNVFVVDEFNEETDYSQNKQSLMNAPHIDLDHIDLTIRVFNRDVNNDVDYTVLLYKNEYNDFYLQETGIRIENGILTRYLTLKETEFIVEDGIVGIGEEAFAGNFTLMEVTLPSSVTTIGSYAFNQCTSLERIHLSEGLREIGNGAFNCCESLVSIEIPSTVYKIGEDTGSSVFSGALSEIIVNANNPYYKSVNGVLYNGNGTQLLLYPTGKTDTYFIVPGTVRGIVMYAFHENSYLETLVVSEGVQYLETSSVLSCDKLKTIFISSNTMIFSDAFDSLVSLEFIYIPEGGDYFVTDGVLFGNEGKELMLYFAANPAESYTIPDGVQAICHYTFNDIQYLKNITIPDSITYIDRETFGRSSIQNYYLKSSTPSDQMLDVFNYLYYNGTYTIYVPVQYLEVYQTAWQEHADKIFGY